MNSCSSGGGSWAAPGDPLTEVLHELRLEESFFCHSELRAPWGLAIPAREAASFHFVAEGGCWLRGLGDAPVRLGPGDLVLVPRGQWHALSDTPDGPLEAMEALPYERIGEGAATLRHGGDGGRAVLICGSVRFEDPAANPLLALMPEVLHLRGDAGPSARLVRAMLDAMAEEALAPRPGSATVITRLADILVIQAVRMWLDHDPGGRAGWLGAMRDPQIGRALALIHRRPEAPWSVARLAAEVHVSRSVFSERFAALVGVPPMQYLTRWRMHLASRWLRAERVGLAEVAARVGYESEPSFSRAFKRHVGVSPGAMRRRA